MLKLSLLHYLAEVGHADAHDVAAAFDLHYPASAMALLRLTRQGLAIRHHDPDSSMYWYSLSEHGWQRYRYLQVLQHHEKTYAP